MLACLLSPCCLEAYERETREYSRARPCPDCGAPILMRYDEDPHLVIECRACKRVYERHEGNAAPGFSPQCPDCGEPAAIAIEPDDPIDIGGPVEFRPYYPAS